MPFESSQLKAKIRKKLFARQKKMNQRVFIRDILAAPLPALYQGLIVGERGNNFRNNYRQKKDTLHRLQSHAKLMMIVAQKHHEAYYPTHHNGQVDAQYNNHITRISLPEFSLYTKIPLKLFEFSHLVKEIEQAATQYRPNVHLSLSSLAVRLDDSKIINVSLYVQCGKSANVRALCKAHTSDNDPNYKHKLFDQRNSWRHFRTPKPSPFVASHSQKPPFVISNQPTFVCKTQGGAQFTQAIDICIDHFFEHANKIYRQSIENQDKIGQTTLIPVQLSHMVTSNHLDQPIASKSLTQPVIHIDPKPRNSRRLAQDKLKLIKTEEIEELLAQEIGYNNTQITSDNSGHITVTDPPFGRNLSIQDLGEKPVPQLSGQLRDQVNQLNNEIVGKNIELLLDANTHSDPQCKIRLKQIAQCEQLNEKYQKQLASASLKNISFYHGVRIVKKQQFFEKMTSSLKENMNKDTTMIFREVLSENPNLANDFHQVAKGGSWMGSTEALETLWYALNINDKRVGDAVLKGRRSRNMEVHHEKYNEFPGYNRNSAHA